MATLARNILGPNGPSTVIVDAAGYRANRSDDLEKLAQTIAPKRPPKDISSMSMV